MHGGATLAKKYNEHVFKNGYPDLILTTDMLSTYPYLSHFLT